MTTPEILQTVKNLVETHSPAGVRVDRFEIVSAAELEPAELALAPAGLATLSRSGPKTVGAAMPDDGAERQSILFSAISGGADLRHFARHYRHFEQLASSAGLPQPPHLRLSIRGFPVTSAGIVARARTSSW